MSEIDGTPAGEVLRGTDGDDSVRGGGGGDLILALGGADLVIGGAADAAAPVAGNAILSGEGDDTVHAGQGSDLVLGGDGADSIFGGGFFDPALAGSGLDPSALARADGPDVLYGGDGDDQVFGEGGDDLVLGGGGDDRLFGRWGDDTLGGGDGDDRIGGGVGADLQTGGAGRDIFGVGFSTAPYVLGTVPASVGPDTGAGEGQRDVITDFTPGEDRINLIGFRFPAPDLGIVFLGEEAFDAGVDALQVRLRGEGDSTIVELYAPFYAPVGGEYRGEVELLGAPALSAADFILSA
jgi:Ca2+-binding RTX toxin-like protein